MPPRTIGTERTKSMVISKLIPLCKYLSLKEQITRTIDRYFLLLRTLRKCSTRSSVKRLGLSFT